MIKYKKKIAGAGAAAMVVAFVLVTASSCSRAKEWQTDEGAVWHTTYRIVYYGAESLSDSIVEVLNEVEQSLSPFKEGSLISRINRNETDSTDALIAEAFGIAQRINRASAGRFDPTVAPLVDLWGFGTDSLSRRRIESGDYSLPQEAIDSALSLVGIGECRILVDGKMVKKHAGTTFNFSSITKGMGCDKVGEMLQRNGVEDYMVEIGGEIAARGKNMRGQPWQIQVDRPEETDGLPTHHGMGIIALQDCGVATSGNYRNFHDTRKYGRVGHTIDPVSGYPIKGEVLSATVIAPTCGEADGWATACMATGDVAAALAMIESAEGVEAMIISAEGDSLVTRTTDRW